MSAPVDIERAGYDTIRKWQDEVYRATKIRAELWDLYSIVHDLSGRSVESLSPELRLLVKRANALVARVEDIA